MRRFAALIIVAVSVLSPIVAQNPNTRQVQTIMREVQPPAPTATGAPELTATDAEAFLDGIVPLQLAREDIAGATVAIVKDGKLLFEKGYGYADVENKKPVSAQETLF